MSLDIVSSDVIEPLLQLAKDPIPNIRFNVAKGLEAIAVAYVPAPEGKTFVQQRIIPVLEQMRGDPDADVRYFASRAFQRAQVALAA